MGMMPAGFAIREIHDVTFEGFKRTSVFISTSDIKPSVQDLEVACRLLMTDKRIGADGSVAFFFWPEDQPVGEIAATASLTYAPLGEWERINKFDEMELVVDFYRY